ncbi:bifunctional demethylmenaquinone methyltransferase/2-methoxy-6-polyprenyl-1,4-benzoquinol methylase UbiE [Bacteroides sp. OttesenSCG-928-D19]|nr:bifunctional demethylmenaquinone methyltransferase/2-methoxy-6-polyprenyl-1,4-benzoquinol methylase UbiE [Bacteroides sp. OttesenSCG-928-N06]MDL2305231.1 bifunctional demethylmenaquinone methyltransferase/2-methoxy-6-polyprenyl-1,4-benzoquinol methylase UbiE [Bacteroides sp. OttesenSCG-928-D19]
MNYPQEHIKPYGESGKKAEQVEHMFDNIAPAYDRLNHTLSFGIDRYWRNKAINGLKPFRPQQVLDVATGTGDFAILACKKLNPTRILATDISEGMMTVGREKVKKEGLTAQIVFERQDSSSFSFSDNCFDAITVAFGIRNFEELDKSLKEMHRVLRPNGHLAILELTTPDRFPMKQLFGIYSKMVIPTIGKIISGDGNAYTYLPQTIKAFPQGEVMKTILSQAGFTDVKFERLTFGICTLYTATKL